MHQSLARVFATVGQEGFWRALVDTLRLLVPLDNALVALMQAGQAPQLLIDFDSKGRPDEQEELASYSAGMYLLDPFYQTASTGIADGLHSLASVAPDQFLHSEYYQSYFRSVVGEDELQFMINVEGGVLGLSLGRSTPFDMAEQGRLLCVRDWVLAAMRRHVQLLPPQGAAAGPPTAARWKATASRSWPWSPTCAAPSSAAKTGARNSHRSTGTSAHVAPKPASKTTSARPSIGTTGNKTPTATSFGRCMSGTSR